jgi:DNA repair protein SbcC/Rad50
LALEEIGLAAILGTDLETGRSNGSGKSSLLEMIEIALFGRRSLAPYLTRGVEDELLLELEFEHGGCTYRVRRTFSPRGRGKTTLDFERYNGAEEVMEWGPLTAESAKETQERICKTIGLSRDTFRHSSYLRQQSRSFADESIEPRERKRLLTEAVLGRDPVWPKLLEAARAEKSTLGGELIELEAGVRHAEEQAAAKPDLERQHSDLVEAETVAADNVADLERSRAQLAAEYQAASEHRARTAAARAELLSAQAALVGVEASLRKAAEAAQTLSVARDELAGLPSYPPLDEIRAREAVLVAAVEAHAQAVRDREAAELEWANADNRRDALVKAANEALAAASALDSHALDECQTCGQALPDEARARAIQSYRDEAAKHELAAAVIVMPELPPVPTDEPPTGELAVCRSAITAAASSEALRATLAERIAAAERILDEQPSDDQVAAARAAVAAKDATLAAVGEPPNIAAIEMRGNEVSEELARARGSLDQHRQQRARVEEHLALATAAEQKLAEASVERGRLQAAVDVVAALERAYSPNGIPALILENAAIPYLETEASRILAELGCPYTLELRTQADLKSGDGVRETLDVAVIDEHGQAAPFEEGTSGGEKTRIGLALRIALARLLAHRRGAQSRMLALDEPGDLDESGMAALVQVLRDLQDEFELILLVSHVPGLRDSFDQTLTVEKQDGVSRIVEAGVFEAVPA